jgi:hypothetical protein
VNPLEAAVLIALLALPWYWVVRRELDRLDDPAWLRERGVVIVRDGAIQERSAPIGQYMGARVWGSVTFKGMVYRFDRVVAPEQKERIGCGELYLEPGLVYVTG